MDGAIRANGQGADEGGAGGSVWITTGTIAGTGLIEARGGRACCGAEGEGGGGAIAVQYDVLEASSTVLDHLAATTGSFGKPGGAGTVLVTGPGSTYGDLVVDNDGVSGRVTDLPSLGTGLAQAGTAGALVVTDKTEAIPAYFVGHWVEVETPSRAIEGTWRIASIAGASFTLAPNGTETIDVQEGDTWTGVYRFDAVTVTGGATLQSVDPVIELATGSLSAAAAWGNLDAPVWDPAGVTISAGPRRGDFRLVVAPFAVADSDGISELRLGDGTRWLSRPWSPVAGATFVATGEPGRELTLIAIDHHGVVRATTPLDAGPVPDGPLSGGPGRPGAELVPRSQGVP